ncbi:MAG TPA: amidase [Thermoanaerobaculia bacterium]|nr:amidase [Thermoanaerobaculia bacterium]
MESSDLCARSTIEMLALLRHRDVSSEELVRSHLRRIELVDGDLHAVCANGGERALAEARLADHDRTGDDRPLLGLPLAIDDLVATRGLVTTLGSPLFAGHVPLRDDPVITRLRGAGAIVLCKTNTSELGFEANAENPLFGATRNPHHHDHASGGPAGGAAAAIAARLAPAAIGYDLGCGLRAPASYCNVIALRPTVGLVPGRPSALAWQTLETAGPMARTVPDIALLLRAIAIADARHTLAPKTPPDSSGGLDRDFTGVRALVTSSIGPYRPARAVAEVFEGACGILAKLGIEPCDDLIDPTGAEQAHRVLRAYYLSAIHYPLLRARRTELNPAARREIEQGLQLNALVLAEAERARRNLWERLADILEQVEFVVTPTTLAPAPRLAQDEKRPPGATTPTLDEREALAARESLLPCYLFGLLGLPAVTMPCGFTNDGLPVGLQIVGRRHADFDVLRLAHAFERRTWFAGRLAQVDLEGAARTLPVSVAQGDG